MDSALTAIFVITCTVKLKYQRATPEIAINMKIAVNIRTTAPEKQCVWNTDSHVLGSLGSNYIKDSEACWMYEENNLEILKPRPGRHQETVTDQIQTLLDANVR